MSSIASWQVAHPALNTSIFRVAAIALVPSILALSRLNGRRWQRDGRRYPLEVPPRSRVEYLNLPRSSEETPSSDMIVIIFKHRSRAHNRASNRRRRL